MRSRNQATRQCIRALHAANNTILARLSRPARFGAEVLRNSTSLSDNEALQPTMLLASAKPLPDLWTAALDEILLSAAGSGSATILEGCAGRSPRTWQHWMCRQCQRPLTHPSIEKHDRPPPNGFRFRRGHLSDFATVGGTVQALPSGSVSREPASRTWRPLAGNSRNARPKLSGLTFSAFSMFLKARRPSGLACGASAVRLLARNART